MPQDTVPGKDEAENLADVISLSQEWSLSYFNPPSYRTYIPSHLSQILREFFFLGRSGFKIILVFCALHPNLVHNHCQLSGNSNVCLFG